MASLIEWSIWLGSLCLLHTVRSSSNQICYSCSGEAHPSSCTSVRRCLPHQSCFLTEFVNNAGYMHYTSGCMDDSRCNTWVNRKRMDLCSECCQGDGCNDHGCGYRELLDNSLVCFQCDDVTDGNSCSAVTSCATGQFCGKWYTSPGVFSMGCSTENNCRNIHVDDKTGCCGEKFCNANSTKIALAMNNNNLHWQTIGSTVTPHDRQLVCHSCMINGHDYPCTHSDLCAVGQVCFAESTHPDNFGNAQHHYGCVDESACNSHTTPNLGFIFGKRTPAKRSEGLKGYEYLYCCNSSVCNNQSAFSQAPKTTTTTTTTTTVPMTTPPAQQSFAPQITSLSAVPDFVSSFKVGTTVYIKCVTSGDPKPDISFSVPLTDDGDPPGNYDLSFLDQGYLAIQSAQLANNGIYTCIAKNENGIAHQIIDIHIVP